MDKKSALVPVMARRLFGTKPLPESMLIQFTDAYRRGDELMDVALDYAGIMAWARFPYVGD